MYDSAALGIDKSIDILEHISDLPTPEARLAAADKIKAVEREGMRSQQPQPGLVELMDYLQARGVRRALCTRNFEYVFLPPVVHMARGAKCVERPCYI